MSEKTINVYLPGTTQYVSGTVNGVSVIWTNTEANVWQAIAAKNPEGMYAVELTLVSVSGMTSQVGLTLYDILGLVTDRTAEDVARWQELHRKGFDNLTAAEKAEWADCKGAYNHSDMNRVEAAVLVIANKLKGIYFPVDVVTKSNWTRADLPKASDFKRYLGNVVKLRNVSSGLHQAPQPPSSMAYLDYVSANKIEETLLYINNWADRMKDSQRYAGEFYGGEM